jgi:erythromycin esterase-like protein
MKSSELQIIIAAAKRAQVFGYGEATHGGAETQRIGAELFRALVDEAGYTVLVLEFQVHLCQHLDRYIRGEESLESAWKYMTKAAYQTTVFRDLLVWMRTQYAAGVPVGVIGMDAGIECVCAWHKSQASTGLHRMTCAVGLRRYKHIEKTGREDTGLRDRFMYQLFMKQYRPGIKYMVYAHMEHIIGRVIDPRLGGYITKRFGAKYARVVVSFYNGKYRAADTATVGADVSDAVVSYKHIKWAYVPPIATRLSIGLHRPSAIPKKTEIMTGGLWYESPADQMVYRGRIDAYVYILPKERPIRLTQ